MDLAVYADGSVIWGHQDMLGYVRTRLTPQGLAWLKARTRTTGLFDHDRALGIGQSSGSMEFHRAGRPVVIAWGPKPANVSNAGLEDRFVAATPSQADQLVKLEEFLRHPLAWALPRDMYPQREPAPFVPTHLWVSWEHTKPDPSKLPSPAREVVTANLEAVLNGACEVISITQAQQIADAMEPLGLVQSGDVTKILTFDMPGENERPPVVRPHPPLPSEREHVPLASAGAVDAALVPDRAVGLVDLTVRAVDQEPVEAAGEPAVVGDRDDGAVERLEPCLERLGGLRRRGCRSARRAAAASPRTARAAGSGTAPAGRPRATRSVCSEAWASS